MPQNRTIPTGNHPDIVTLTVKSGGSVIDSTIEVNMVSVVKEFGRIPAAKLVVLDGDPASETFSVSNRDIFIPGKEIEILSGYHAHESSIFKGIVVKNSIKIRANGQSVLIVEARDKAFKMTLSRHSKYFYEAKDSQAWQELIEQYGLSTSIETTGITFQELVQFDATDWDFVVSRAELNGMLVNADAGKIEIKKPDVSASPLFDLTFGSTIRELDAEMDARLQTMAVEAKSWDPAAQETNSVEGNNPNIRLNGNLNPGTLAQAAGAEKIELRHTGNLTTPELQSWADAWWMRHQLAKIRGRVKFQGVATPVPGVLLNLTGVGDRFNGPVFVTGVKHTIADGDWETDVQFGLDPDWFLEKIPLQSSIYSGGRANTFSGLQIGIVTQLENDPSGENRILVRLPAIDPNGQGVWSRFAAPDAGNNRGVYFRPEIGDEVVVGFLNGDKHHPVVLGGLHSSSNPAPIAESDDNHEKGVVTRSEMKMIFNDEKSSFTLSTPAGKSFVLDDDAGLVELKDENGNKITMDSNGIVIESPAKIKIKATQDLELEGMNSSVKAQLQFKAEGSAGAEVSSNGAAVLRGSIVQIN